MTMSIKGKLYDFSRDDIVVIRYPERPDIHGYLGTLEYIDGRECVQVKQGCGVLTIDPQHVERYNDYKHGKPPMKVD